MAQQFRIGVFIFMNYVCICKSNGDWKTQFEKNYFKTPLALWQHQKHIIANARFRKIPYSACHMKKVNQLKRLCKLLWWWEFSDRNEIEGGNQHQRRLFFLQKMVIFQLIEDAKVMGMSAPKLKKVWFLKDDLWRSSKRVWTLLHRQVCQVL